jgi:hypothetical protein
MSKAARLANKQRYVQGEPPLLWLLLRRCGRGMVMSWAWPLQWLVLVLLSSFSQHCRLLLLSC